MYAVVKVGGRQERVRPGDVLDVDYQSNRDPGETIELKPILVVDDDGKPHGGPKALAQASVRARLLGEKKGEKVKVFKYRPKTRYQRTQGHRQLHTLLEIEEIALSPDRVARKPEEAAEEAAPKETASKKPAAKKPASKKPAASKASSKKPAAGKKTTAKKTTAKKTTAKKTTAKKTASRKKT
ncbi:MAG TPA: 50S ribosomal protein L21 [Actinomycetota bacterium]|nr:50S ribosomal protein L21 [Actinomycetota bacterium]